MTYQCDVLVVKYAQALYGLDEAVVHRLHRRVPQIDTLSVSLR
jgi:hypothetical protein